MSQDQQFCPICQRSVPPSPRYPRYVCTSCATRVNSKDGRLLKFSNIDMSGGFTGEYHVSGQPYDSHECYIDGILCYADEAHLGGIVIQPIE